MILEHFYRILNNKYFVSFIVMSLIISSILFQLLNPYIRGEIIIWIQYPFIIIPLIIIIIFISNFNILLAVIMLIFLLIIILPLYQSGETIKLREGFKTKYEIDNREQDENTQYYVDGIKNIITGKLKNIETHHNNEMKKGILENKKKILQKETMKNTNNIGESDDNIKMISKRIFNPNKEDDTNLLITKEILQDMIKRIEYNYENTIYLKKYIKSRIEEIIDTNDLLNEDI